MTDQERIAALDAEVKRLREALEFYAGIAKDSWTLGLYGDGGRRAREVLKGGEE